MSELDIGLVGDSAAVVTSCLWTISSIFFTTAGKRIGSLSVNAYRTVLAIGFLVVTHALLLGSLLPFATAGQWFWMGISGIVGLGIGDSGLFAAYVTIGPRRSLLVMALAPLFSALGAYLMLGETIPAPGIVGIGITLAGVMIVILESEERSGEAPISNTNRVYGLFFAVVAAIGQGVGLVLSKKGIDLYPNVILNPVSATLMRLLFGGLFIWVLALAWGRKVELSSALRNKSGLSNTLAGAIVGPFLGITFSMVAVTFTQAGVAQTLMSLMPVLIIPLLWVLYRQRTSRRGIIGAMVAVVGVAIIFLT